jgi:hypothetical protein
MVSAPMVMPSYSLDELIDQPADPWTEFKAADAVSGAFAWLRRT